MNRINYMWQMMLPSPLRVIIYLENKQVMDSICSVPEKGEISFCLCHLRRLPVIHITFCFNAYSVIKLFSHLPLWRSFLRWQEILFLIIFSQELKIRKNGYINILILKGLRTSLPPKCHCGIWVTLTWSYLRTKRLRKRVFVLLCFVLFLPSP